MDELMEMRRQLAAMKESLDKSRLANNQLLKKVMSGKASLLNRIVMWEIIALPFIVLIMLANCKMYDATPWVVWSFMILGIADILVDLKTVRIPAADVYEMPLLELRNKILRQKRLRRIQTIIGLSLSAVWAVWAFVEWFKPFDYIDAIRSGDAVVWTIIILLAVLLGLATMFALWLLRKIDRANDSMLAEIDDSESRGGGQSDAGGQLE